MLPFWRQHHVVKHIYQVLRAAISVRVMIAKAAHAAEVAG